MAASISTIPYRARAGGVPNGAVVLLGRFLFALIFLLSWVNHLGIQAMAYAEAQGVPLASIVVPYSGTLAVIGALSILTGYRARVGAWLIVLFLLPVTFAMHNFWAVHDPLMKQLQMNMFLKNLAMLGGALLISQYGSGPLSLDAPRSL